MSEKDAGIAGKMLASAAIIAAVGFAIGAACFGISFILWKKSLLTTNRIFHYYFYQGVVALNPKRKSAPDSIAVFLCVKFVISFSFIAIKT